MNNQTDDIVNDPEFEQHLQNDLLVLIERVIRDSFELQRPFWVETVRQQLELCGFGGSSPAADNESWTGVESLSRLRSIVGGRFDALKRRWLSAGLPLREHRGSKVGEFEIEKAGWLDLTSWINEQGFEVRLCERGSEHLFELRKHIRS